ncbi:MAG: 6,7-dimethyl-8-ribityllumazine synthase, partial [Edaphobacter sp.]|nr:6,7-dimethyl-8-ribityllumazine synthase [Edaphobacter sp.]
GIGQSQQETGVPHAFGVLTCETLEQALDRAGLKAGNKGFEAATAAIEMVSLQRKLAAGTVDPSARLSGLAGGFSPLNAASEKEGFSPGSSSFTPKSSGSSK